MNDKELERKAKKFNETLDSLKEEAKRVEWTPEYLLQHWDKEKRLVELFKRQEILTEK